MKLEAGMYVRTSYGIIEKIEDVLEFDGIDYYLNSFHTAVKVDKETDVAGSKGKITKASHNIIDLIEIGDYVNGQKVNKIIVDKDISNNDKLKFGDDDLVLTFKSNHDTYYLYVEYIESILTKEQFNQIAYVVE